MHNLTLKSLTRGFFSVVLLCFLSISQAAETGLLWRIEAPNGKVSHVFGTIHVDDVRVTDFSPAILKALEQSEVFMMETLPPSDPSLYFLPNHNLREALTEQEWDKAKQLADLHAMQDDVVMRMKPWLLAMLFDLPASQGPYTQDIRLYAKAQEQDKEIEGLEDTREHFTMLDSLTKEEQLIILRSALQRSQEEKERDFEDLLNAYLKGDTAVIAKVDEKATASSLPPALWQKMRSKLLEERNATMAQHIADKADDRCLFVAVGAAHLAGKDGILARLRQAGYKVSVIALR
ncbi:MAG TPA: TraB/GumN family protein [Methylophilaceae bacterium]|nr:TraB/GumN family protein [Methylophilaceae bacterium]